MKIKPKNETKNLSRRLKFLFSLNNNTSTRGPSRKPTRYSGQLKTEKVIVKSTIHSHEDGEKAGKSLRYITRDSVREYERDGEDRIINRQDVDRWEKDKFHYMLVISPKDSRELMLDGFTKELVREMERDLSTNLQWVAAVHRNTDNPHVHLMIRGKDDRGNDLEIKTQYLHRVVPQISREIATARLQADRELNLRDRTRDRTHDRNEIQRTSAGRSRE